MNAAGGIRVMGQEPLEAPFPRGAVRVHYASGQDGARDRAIVYPGEKPTWWVMIHGHGSHEDQLFTRADIRRYWLEPMRASGGGILAPNLRDNAWMSPAATADLRALLDWARREQGAERFLFLSGSMGGSSNLYYAAQHPEDVAGVAALGAAPDPAVYATWCRGFEAGTIQRQIGAAIEGGYGGGPEAEPAVYAERDAIGRADRLAMPIFLAHGELDLLMPVAPMRELAAALRGRADLAYREIPGGNHDSPLALGEAVGWLWARAGQS